MNDAYGHDVSDAVLARVLADEAGAALLRIRAEGRSDSESRSDAESYSDAALKAAGDRGAHEVLIEALARYRPGDVVLSEEGADPRARLAASRVWIIDPLDGTREFGEPGRHDWAVHVALWQEGELVAGAVALPAAGVTYATDDPPVVPERPASSDGSTAPIRLAVSRTRPPAFVQALAEHLGAELVPMGSAGYKCASVWRGEADAYVHGGGQYEWDSAAPVAVARAAGLHTSRLDGSPLVYNRTDPLLPDLVVCRPELARVVVEWTTSHTDRVPAT